MHKIKVTTPSPSSAHSWRCGGTFPGRVGPVEHLVDGGDAVPSHGRHVTTSQDGVVHAGGLGQFLREKTGRGSDDAVCVDTLGKGLQEFRCGGMLQPAADRGNDNTSDFQTMSVRIPHTA